MKQFSTEELILNIYNETSPLRASAIEEELESNWALKEKNAVISESVQLLQEGWSHPRRQALDRILAYAKGKTRAAKA